MRRLLQKYPQALAFLLFPLLGGLYFLSQQLPLQHHSVFLRADGYIPFLPGFVIFYILWYLYVPAPMLYACFRRRELFLRQCLTLFPGAMICTLLFFLWPSRIDFRPDAAGEGLLRALVRLLYQADAPVNVFPSLHCYEALAIHLATFHSRPGVKRRALRCVSAVLCALICASTLLIRQHSLADLLAGCTLAAAMHILVLIFYDKRRTSS